MTSNDSTPTAKARLRAELKGRRAAISPADRHAASLAIAQHAFTLPEIGAARTVFCYVSFGSEVETHAILERLLHEGRTVLVPRLVDRERMIARELRAFGELEAGPMGILAPAAGPESLAIADVALTPGLGFTRCGDRIGFGAGYYDRWFARNAGTLRVALAFDCQMVDTLPTSATDARLDRIVTESGVLQTRREG